MKTPKELFVGIFIGLIVVTVAIRHFSNTSAQLDEETADATAMLVNTTSDDNGVEKRISKEQVTPVFKKNGKAQYIVIDIYPVKNSEKEPVGLEVVYRNPAGELLAKAAPESTFKRNARNYVDHLKTSNKLHIPYGYQILATEAHFGVKSNLVLDLDPKTLTLIYSYDSCRFPPGCYSPTNSVAGKESAPPYLTATPIFDKYIANDSCRYPPGCPMALKFTSTMESLLSEKNKKEAQKKK